MRLAVCHNLAVGPNPAVRHCPAMRNNSDVVAQTALCLIVVVPASAAALSIRILAAVVVPFTCGVPWSTRNTLRR
jgi:hypothetical protein